MKLDQPDLVTKYLQSIYNSGHILHHRFESTLSHKYSTKSAFGSRWTLDCLYSMRSLIGCSLSNVLWNKTTNSELDNLISVFVDSVLKLLNCSFIVCFRYSQREKKPKGWVLWFEKWWVVPLLQSNHKFILQLSPSPNLLICTKSV